MVAAWCSRCRRASKRTPAAEPRSACSRRTTSVPFHMLRKKGAEQAARCVAGAAPCKTRPHPATGDRRRAGMDRRRLPARHRAGGPGRPPRRPRRVRPHRRRRARRGHHPAAHARRCSATRSGMPSGQRLLDANPVEWIQWKAPGVAETVDGRVVASPAQVTALLAGSAPTAAAASTWKTPPAAPSGRPPAPPRSPSPSKPPPWPAALRPPPRRRLPVAQRGRARHRSRPPRREQRRRPAQGLRPLHRRPGRHRQQARRRRPRRRG